MATLGETLAVQLEAPGAGAGALARGYFTRLLLIALLL